MNAHVSLLPALAACARPARADHAAQRRDAVLTHLRALLNTRAGSAAIDPSYGLPDLTDLARGSAHAARELADAVAGCIRRHEPRLRDLTVHAEPAPVGGEARLRFALHAQLADAPPLRLTGQLEPGGHISLAPRDR